MLKNKRKENHTVTREKLYVSLVIKTDLYDVFKHSSTPNNLSLHNINYRKLHFIVKYTYDSETE